MTNTDTKLLPTKLSDMDKAAILLTFMDDASAAKIVSKLSQEDVTKLAKHMATLPSIGNDSAHSVIQSFFKEFSSHSGVSGAPRAFLERILNQAIGNGMAQKMLDGIYGDALKEDFQRLQWVSPEILAKSFESQHPHMQAVLLSFLPDDTSSEVLKHFPKESHYDLFQRVANLQEVTSTVIEELKIAVEECIKYVSEQNSATVNGVKQAAEMLNRYDGDREALLETLKVSDEELAQRVTENMFDFATLARQDETTLSAIVDAVERDQLAIALKGSDAQHIKAAIMGAITQRMGEAIEQQIELMGTTPVSQVEQARKELMALVRSMNDEETIKYKIFEEKVVE